jgi:hypothetical protein
MIGNGSDPGPDAEHEHHGDSVDEGDMAIGATHDSHNPNWKVVGNHGLLKDRVAEVVRHPASGAAKGRRPWSWFIRG